MNRTVNELRASKSLWKPHTSYTAKVDAGHLGLIVDLCHKPSV